MKTSLMAAIVIIVVVVIAVGAYYVSKSSQYGGTSTVGYTSTALYTTAASTSIASTSVAPTTSVASNSSTTTVNSTTTPANTTTIAANTVNASYTVNIAHSASVGYYLANASDFTLYYFTQDTANSGKSACYGSCASAWPPFYASSLVLPSSLSASNFSVISRTDGTMQLAYKGYPLYRFASDTSANQVSGNGVGGFKVYTVSANATT